MGPPVRVCTRADSNALMCDSVRAAALQGLEKNMEHYSHTAVQSAKIQSHRPLLVRPTNQRAPCRADQDDMWTASPMHNMNGQYQTGAQHQQSNPQARGWSRAALEPRFDFRDKSMPIHRM